MCLADAPQPVDHCRVSLSAPAALELCAQGTCLTHKSMSKGRKWMSGVKTIQLRSKFHHGLISYQTTTHFIAFSGLLAL